MANNKKSKKNKGQSLPVKMSPEKYIRERARKLPIGKCYINPKWKESGLATILISRTRANGNSVVCIFLTDFYCLGVKDVIYHSDVDAIDFKDILNRVFKNGYEEISYNEAHNMIYGAIEFAEEADIEPYKDFDTVGQYILEEDTDDIPLIEYEYGKNGKHLLVVGPSGKEECYIKTLTNKFGEDGFDYIGPENVIRADFEECLEAANQREDMMDYLMERMKSVKAHYDSPYHKAEEYHYKYPEYPFEVKLKYAFIADALFSADNYAYLPEDIINHIISLPADEAAEDISNLMLTEIGRTYQEINDGTIEQPENSVLMHGVLLLTQLGSPKGLGVLLEILRQNDRFLDYHFGDLAPEIIFPALYSCGKYNLETIEAYLYEPGYGWYPRSQAPKALTMSAINHPEKREEVIEIYRRLLRSLPSRLPNQEGCDSAFAGNVMSELISLRAKELIPEIQDVYATGYVDDLICGNAAVVTEFLKDNKTISYKEDGYKLKDIHQEYDHLKKFLVG